MDSSFIIISDLVSTVALYFYMNTMMANREAEVVTILISDSIFCVDNAFGVGLPEVFIVV